MKENKCLFFVIFLSGRSHKSSNGMTKSEEVRTQSVINDIGRLISGGGGRSGLREGTANCLDQSATSIRIE